MLEAWQRLRYLSSMLSSSVNTTDKFNLKLWWYYEKFKVIQKTYVKEYLKGKIPLNYLKCLRGLVKYRVALEVALNIWSVGFLDGTHAALGEGDTWVWSHPVWFTTPPGDKTDNCPADPQHQALFFLTLLLTMSFLLLTYWFYAFGDITITVYEWERQ